ncbi:MAG: hypothetical protein O3A00_27045 [Planctomycetota bacterium]|nr:hypothetical protein [Planctomycetota bacterium]
MIDAPRQKRWVTSLCTEPRFHWRRLRVLVCCLSACLCGVDFAAAQPGDEVRRVASSRADDYISKLQASRRFKTELELLGTENTALEKLTGKYAAPTESLLTQTRNIDAGSKKILGDLLQVSFDGLAQSLQQPRDRIQDDFKRVRNEWLDVRTSLNEAILLKANAQHQQQALGGVALVLDEENRWIWLAGLWLVAVIIVVIAIDRRHFIRRLGWVRRVESMGLKLALGAVIALPLVGTVITFFFGQLIIAVLLPNKLTEIAEPTELTRPIAELEQEIVRDGLADRHTEFKTENKKLRDDWLKAMSTDADRSLAAAWLQSRSRIRESAVEIDVLAAALKQLKNDVNEWETVQTSVAAERDKLDVAKSERRWAGAGLGGAFLLLSGGVGFVFYSRARTQQAQIEKTCPRCLAVGSLVPNVDEMTGSSLGRLGLEELRCNNIITDDPYQECEFVFAAEYRSRRKLGFPTLGVADSGKTHWLAMAYRELNQGRFPEMVNFEKVRSEASRQFDILVQQILDARIGTSATVANRIPDPLIFNFRDNDRLGRSDVLASVFDYAGQITTDVESFHRRRALDADGYVFFLDPTKSSDAQARALTDFREDLRLTQGLQPGKHINRPVALCVSKLDLMVNRPYAEETNEIIDFYTDLGDVDANFGELSIRLIEKRSQLMESIRDTVWPGWNIERQIHDLFGGRYMFFPLTPVGMNEPGETDLNQRVIEPYGILEPLLWLLHMNGYPVLE